MLSYMVKLNEPFDSKFYLQMYPELVKKGINNPIRAKKHYIKFGKKEGRIGHPTELQCTRNNIKFNEDYNNFIYNPNFLKISKNNFLFFDIFCINDVIYIIRPIYKKSQNFLLFLNNNHLIEIKKEKYEILYGGEYGFVEKYKLPITKYKYNIIIEFNCMYYHYELINVKKKYKNKIAFTTLFKDDWKLFKINYDYYKNQGIENFYMYYNGKPSEEIINLYNLPGVKLISWDFNYWNDKKYIGPRHHAQGGQLQHSLYCFGKGFHDYMIFADLDEYLYIPNKTIFQEINESNFDLYGFCNLWSKTLDTKIPDIFPKDFKTVKNHIKYGVRSKNIVKLDKLTIMGVHFPLKDQVKIKNTEFIMFHFWNWSNHDNNRGIVDRNNYLVKRNIKM